MAQEFISIGRIKEFYESKVQPFMADDEINFVDLPVLDFFELVEMYEGSEDEK